MGIAADLFHSFDPGRETLHRRITPTDDQQTAQQERWNDLADFLKARLKNDTGCSMRTWLQGSYKFGTQIRPHNAHAQFDIDLGLYFEWEGEPEEGDHEPEELKALVQDALLGYYSDAENDATGVENPKERCNRITFAPDFHIDVPCYHLDAERDARALATETLGWEGSDPKAIYVWLKDEQKDQALRTKVRRQVRYLKMWAALTFAEGSRPSSILLTVLVADAVREMELVSIDDADLFENIAAVVHARLADVSDVSNPVDTDEDLNRLSDEEHAEFVAQLETLVDVAARANGTQDKFTAAETWTEAFGHFFPMPEDNEEMVAEKAETTNALVPFQFDPQIAIVATPKKNSHVSWKGLNELQPIPKDCDIAFSLQNAPPPGSRLRWTVRNRGDEAAGENDLGHHAGDEATITEHSAYNGDHAMDLTVLLGNQVIGRRRVWIKVRGIAVPPRNPARRRHVL